MRTIIVVLFLACLALAEDSGYNYQAVEQTSEDLSFAPAVQSPQQDDAGLIAQPQEAYVENPAPQPAVLTSEFQKEYYTFDAPQDSSDDNLNEQIANSLKQSLRVVFIKAPENQGFEKAALSLAKQAAQQHTDIYVLSKQTDIGSLAQQLQNVRSQSQNTPEVHFVKYRTPEDADNAQRAIQQQYNSLPGTAQNVNGGVAPVLNFASRAPVAAGHIPAGPGHQYLPANPIRTADYLPPSLRRFRV